MKAHIIGKYPTLTRSVFIAATLLVVLTGCGQPESSKGTTQPSIARDVITYVSRPLDNSENLDIYAMDASGNSVSRITTYEGPDFYPSWSADGQTMAFVSDRDEPGNYDVYVLDAATGVISRVTSDPAIDTAPDISPDGETIVFSRNVEGTDEIVRIDVDGSNEVQLTSNLVVDASPKWSPDGSRIVFARNVAENVDIYLMDANGTGVSQLTTETKAEDHPVWSPRGDQIAFIRQTETGSDLWVMNASGGNQRRLATGTVSDPTWFPDGARIVYATTAATQGPFALYTVRAADKAKQKLREFSTPAVMLDWRP